MHSHSEKSAAQIPTQAGNVFLIILLGIVLFAALALVVSRSMRGDTATTMSGREAALAAVDILSYGQRLERAVTKLRSRNISENDLDFTNAVVAGYEHTPVLAATYGIFNAAGAGVTWQNPPEGVNDGSAWRFTGATCIPDVGAGGGGCASDGSDNEELLAILPGLKESVCLEINRRLSITPLPSGGALSASQFTGAFSDGSAPTGANGLKAACVSIGGNFAFYAVLLAR